MLTPSTHENDGLSASDADALIFEGAERLNATERAKLNVDVALLREKLSALPHVNVHDASVVDALRHYVATALSH